MTIVIAIVYYLMNKISFLDNLGRSQRSHADTQMENVVAHLSKLALQHEKDADGIDKWVIAQRTSEQEEDE